MIRDENVEWLRKRIYIPAGTFSGVGIGQATAAYTANTGVASWGEAAAASVVLKNINSSNIQALAFTTQTTDLVVHAWMTPYDLDINKDVSFRMHWTNGTSASTNQWGLTYALLNAPANSDLSTSLTAIGSTNLGAIPPATYNALDTVIPASASSAANAWEITDMGHIKASAHGGAAPLKTTTYALSLKINLTTLANTPALLGIEIRYTMRKAIGQRRNIIGGKRLAEALGVQWTNTRQEGL
jgi:hypothetical protein